MKKIMMIVVLLGIAGIAAAPFVIGTKLESVTREQVELTNQRLKDSLATNPYLKNANLTLKSYEKGYASSVAQGLLQLETMIPTESGEPLTVEIPFTNHIQHGPYLGDSGFGLAKIISRPDIEAMELPGSIKADTVIIEDVIDFTGHVSEIMTVKPVTYDTGEGVVVEFEGLEAKAETTLKDPRNFNAEVAFKAIKVHDGDLESGIQVKPFAMNIEGQAGDEPSAGSYQLSSEKIAVENKNAGVNASIQSINAQGTYNTTNNRSLALGKHEMSLKNIQFSDPSMSKPVSIPELKFTSLAREDGQDTLTLAANYSATFDGSLAAMMSFPVAPKTAAIDFQMSSIPVNALEVYTALIQELNDPEQIEGAMTALEEQLPDIIRSIVNQAAALKVSANVNTEEGELTGELDVAFAAENELTRDDALALMAAADEDPAAVLSLLAGQGHVKLDKSVTDKAEMTPMLQMMAADFIKLEDGAFKSELLIKEGEVLVNGQPLLPLLTGLDADGSGADNMIMPEGFSPEDLSEEEQAELKALLEGNGH